MLACDREWRPGGPDWGSSITIHTISYLDMKNRKSGVYSIVHPGIISDSGLLSHWDIIWPLRVNLCFTVAKTSQRSWLSWRATALPLCSVVTLLLSSSSSSRHDEETSIYWVIPGWELEGQSDSTVVDHCDKHAAFLLDIHFSTPDNEMQSA